MSKRRGGVDLHCEVCNCKAELQKGRFGYFYRCPECGSTVGCKPHTKEPLGILADEETRKLRIACHDKFDPRWQKAEKGRRQQERTRSYTLLAEKLGIPVEECHFGMMNKEQLQRCLFLMEIEA